MTDRNHTYKIFTPSGCLSLEALKRYQSKALSADELNLVEDHINTCELCADASEGINQMSDKNKLESIVSEINNNLKKGLKEEEISSKPAVFLTQNRIMYVAAAASIIILVGLFSYFQFFMNQAEQLGLAEEIKQNKELPVPSPKAEQITTEEYILEKEEIRKSSKSNASKTAVIKQEKQTVATKESLQEKGADYRPPMEKIKSADSGTKAFSITEKNSQKQDEIWENESRDIASTQPIEYYISGITISEEFDDEFGIETSTENQDEGLAKNKISRKGKGTKENEKQYQNKNHFFEAVSQNPEFPGGQIGLFKYLEENLKYPVVAKKLKIQGSVLVSFIVEENGQISSVKMLRGIGGGCDEEAVRVISEMPTWKPAEKDGKGERILFKMPIAFRLY